MRGIRTGYHTIFGTLQFPSNHLSGTAAFLRSMLLYVFNAKQFGKLRHLLFLGKPEDSPLPIVIGLL